MATISPNRETKTGDEHIDVASGVRIF